LCRQKGNLPAVLTQLLVAMLQPLLSCKNCHSSCQLLQELLQPAQRQCCSAQEATQHSITAAAAAAPSCCSGSQLLLLVPLLLTSKCC
jgi:hypothetical protein